MDKAYMSGIFILSLIWCVKKKNKITKAAIHHKCLVIFFIIENFPPHMVPLYVPIVPHILNNSPAIKMGIRTYASHFLFFRR